MKKTSKHIFLNFIGISLVLLFFANVFAADTDNNYEIKQARQFASENKLIVQTDIQTTDMYGFLTRSDMAEILVNYDIKVLGQIPNTGLICNFTDMSDESTETQTYATLACQLGIMGVTADPTSKNGAGLIPAETFSPKKIVTRAEFGTALSRLLYGDIFNGGTPYYINHLNALKDARIISYTNPHLKEVRGYAILMFMRAEKEYVYKQ